MEQPQGFEDAENPDCVCEVHRLIYCLKQLPRECNLELHAALLKFGLKQSTFDPTLCFRLQNSDILGTVAVHVDDLVIAGEPKFVDSLIARLGKRFTIRTDEELHHFLSLQVERDFDGQLVYLSQEHYINDMKACFFGESSVKVPTPTDSNFRLVMPCLPNEKPPTGPYNQLVGSLLWAAQ